MVVKVTTATATRTTQDLNGVSVGKIKGWRRHEELHRDYWGVMQAKPMRTDIVKDGMYAAKDRFKMKARQPDVETEV